MGSHTAHPPLHTAEHLLTRLLFARFPSLSDFHTRLKSRKCVLTFRYEGSITEADRVALEEELQGIRDARLPVVITMMPRAEAEQRLPNLHQVPAEADPVRVVRVGEGVDERACIGTHVTTTAEIENPRIPTLRSEGDHLWRLNLVVG